jgi:hypothetical protein
MGTAVFEGVQDAVKLNHSDIKPIDLGVESTAAGEHRRIADIDPAANRLHRYSIPVCRRAASDIID